MYKALVIGCGNIGAGYDLYNEQVLTYVKAISLNNEMQLTLFDINEILAKEIAKKYTCSVAKDIKISSLEQYDMISICTPTSTHCEILQNAIIANPRLIICEKPISEDIEELERIEQLYLNTSTKILVNYIRRFQPAYKKLSMLVKNILMQQKLMNITVKYQKGFLNNCSHAFDLIEYLTGEELMLGNIQKSDILFDHFAKDPTLSLLANWNEVNVIVTGLSGIKYPLFEIDLFFEHSRVSITESGNTIKVYNQKQNLFGISALVKPESNSTKGAINNYMQHVIEYALEILRGDVNEDNFINSVALNKRMLNYIIE